MFITLPDRRSSIAGTNALQQLNTPRTLTACRRSRSAAVVFGNDPTWPMPAMFARTSTFPTFCAARTQSSSLDTSSTTNFAPKRSATVRPLASSWSASQTVTPAWTNASTMAAPIPEAPPVTRAVLFSRLNTINPFRIGVKELLPILLFRQRELCPDRLKPAMIIGRQGHYGPIASEHQPSRAKALRGVVQIRREVSRPPSAPVGLSREPGNFGHHIGQYGEGFQIIRPRLKHLVAYVRFAKVVEGESDFRHSARQFGRYGQLLVPQTQIERETELSQQPDARQKFWTQTKFRIRLRLQVSPHALDQRAAREEF